MNESSNLANALAAGGLTALETVRDCLAADLEECQSFRDRAALYRRLLDVLNRIEALRPAQRDEDDIDMIRSRRNRRGFAAGTGRGSRLLLPH